MTVETSWIVGTAPGCDIRVDSPTVSGRHCRLTQRGESFLLEDLESRNGTFVADERITGPRLVRRDEPVTLGPDASLPWSMVPISISVGRSPDNDVVIPYDAVSSHHACVQRDARGVFLVDLGSTNGTAINDPDKKISRAPLNPNDFVFLGTHRVAATDLVAALPDSQLHATTVPQQSRPEELSAAATALQDAPALGGPTAYSFGRSWFVGIALSLVVVVAFLGGAGLLRSRGPQVDETAISADTPLTKSQQPNASGESAKPKPTVAVTEEPTPPADKSSAAEKVATADRTADPTETPDDAERAPQDPWDQVRDEMRGAVFLLAVEDTASHRTWPVGSATAIGENTLLTSGNRVRELAAGKQRGWTMWAINEPSDIKVEIEGIQVHFGFKNSKDDQEKIYFDLGLVRVPTTLSTLVPLAGPAELETLEPGLKLGCVGVEYEVEPLYRFQSNEPDLNRATVLEVVPLDHPPAPSLLIFQADLPTKQYGAAVVNEQGKLCAVLAEFQDTDRDAEIKMHFAPLVDGAVIASGDLWVEPSVPKDPEVVP